MTSLIILLAAVFLGTETFVFQNCLRELVPTIVGEFSLICCTSMAHAGNTKISAKIISAYAKKCSITGFLSLRGHGRGRAKNASIYALSGHERIEKRSDQ